MQKSHVFSCVFGFISLSLRIPSCLYADIDMGIESSQFSTIMTEQQLKSITVDDLFSSGKISRKTYNTLVRARMRNVYDLKRYQSGLPRLFRPGASGMKEINILLHQIETADGFAGMSQSLFLMPEPDLSKGEELLANLDDEQIQLLDLVYKRKLQEMQISRKRNTTKMGHALWTVPVTMFIRDFLLEKNDRVQILNEVGEVSMRQVQLVKDAINHELDIINAHEIPTAYRIYELKADGFLDDFTLSFYKTHRRLPLLYVIQNVLLLNKDKQMVKAFLQRYDVFEGKVEVDSEKIGKSAYTVTTYSNTVFDALFVEGKPMAPLSAFLDSLIVEPKNTAYLTQYVGDSLLIDGDLSVRKVVEDEHLLFNSLSVVAIMGKLLQRDFVSLGGYPRSFGAAMDERWNHSYLVRRELNDRFNFMLHLWKFRDSIVRTSTEYHSVDIFDYLQKEWGDNATETELFDEIAQDFRKMLNAELQLPIDENGCLIIPKFKEKSLADRLFIILDKEKQPLSLDTLTERINAGDGRRYVKASVSLALNKDDRFQGSGKKGVYALSVWQLPYFGSNADIVYEVLNEWGRPMKSDEIIGVLSQCSYNKQFSKNDLSSVFSLGKKLFVKLGQGYYGIVGKEYPPREEWDKMKMEDDISVKLPDIEVEDVIPPVFPLDDVEPKEEPQTAVEEVFEGMNTPVETVDESPVAEESVAEASVAEEPIAEVPIPEGAIAEETTVEESVVETPVAEESITEAPVAEEAIAVETVAEEPVVEETIPVEEEAVPVVIEDKKEGAFVNERPEPAGEIPEGWLGEWEQVQNFVEQYQREPIAIFTAEVHMAEWLAEQKRLMHEEVLTEQQINKLLQLRDRLW